MTPIARQDFHDGGGCVKLNTRNTELFHYGVKGMKWGVRRKRNEHNKNYTDKQRKNDRAMYGDRAEKRINRKLNEGYGLRGARHFEVERRERKEKRKKTAKKVVKTIGKATAAVGSAWLTDQIFYGGAGTRIVTNLGKDAIDMGAKFARAARQAYWDTHPRYSA